MSGWRIIIHILILIITIIIVIIIKQENGIIVLVFQVHFLNFCFKSTARANYNLVGR